ncbi:MAG: FAD-dependent oxidoreductase [Phycisphaerales bacterium]|nr:FAD-dependent oxidoreductase [Phycisphaerales bacterium]
MRDHSYPYVVLGAGLAAASAVEGIRLHDSSGSIVLIGAEQAPPYDRPPLSKQLWSGAKTMEEIFLHPGTFYAEQGVELQLGTSILALDPASHTLRDADSAIYRYRKLLLATGGTPRRLSIPGGDLDGVSYFRMVQDYKYLRRAADAAQSALVVGGGFIGSEIAAALSQRGLRVTMVFPGQHLGSRVFPESLGRAITAEYRAKGVEVVAGDRPLAIARHKEAYRTTTQGGRDIVSDLVVVGIGIEPNIQLAQAAGLRTGNGVVVDQFLRTSDPDIYAAGDVAYFPDPVLGPRRVEHWDNALSQGKHAGANMAGAGTPFGYIPFFFSDLFEFGYEAVGDTDARLETFADWQEENKTGVVYYLRDGLVRGAMMCNLFERVDAARALIQRGERVKPNDLRGAIR